MLPQDPSERESLYRRNPDAFRKAWEQETSEGRSTDLRAAWEARFEIDMPSDAPLLEQSTRPFRFPIAASLFIAVILLIPYWRTGTFDLEWAVPYLATLAFGPFLLYYGWGHVRFLALSASMAGLLALFWFGFEDWLLLDVLESGVDKGLDVGIARQMAAQSGRLMLLHWPILLFGLTASIWVSKTPGMQRVDFIHHAIQVAIHCAIIVVTGFALTGLTYMLIDVLLGFEYTEELMTHLMTWGASGALVFGHAVWRSHPTALDRILPLIARIFIPLFCLLEVGFLSVYVGKGLAILSHDRETLFIMNLLLLAVLILVILHAAFETIQSRFNQILLYAIVSLGVVAGLIGIVAIASRLWEFGLTPNRLVVFISNILLIGTLGSLLWSMARNPSKDSTQTVRLSLNQSLPIFIAWAAVVTFLFPLLFGLPVVFGQ
ncbi:MAG: hypothetical protein MUP94_04185 [Flavobacteriales bacterium]|jgi:hypothetical protein|nr:hypothetical protein [Flavobacteriales bacterium]